VKLCNAGAQLCNAQAKPPLLRNLSRVPASDRSGRPQESRAVAEVGLTHQKGAAPSLIYHWRGGDPSRPCLHQYRANPHLTTAPRRHTDGIKFALTVGGLRPLTPRLLVAPVPGPLVGIHPHLFAESIVSLLSIFPNKSPTARASNTHLPSTSQYPKQTILHRPTGSQCHTTVTLGAALPFLRSPRGRPTNPTRASGLPSGPPSSHSPRRRRGSPRLGRADHSLGR
jgi:hypothetical protein